MTRYLQQIFELSRHPLESVNKFPEVFDMQEDTQRQQSRTAKRKIVEDKNNTSIKIDHL